MALSSSTVDDSVSRLRSIPRSMAVKTVERTSEWRASMHDLEGKGR